MANIKNMIIPTVYETTERGTRASDIYSKLLDDRIIMLNEDINEYSTNLVMSQMLYLASVSDEDITLYVNSPGGSVHDGLQIIDTIRTIKPEVATIVTGLAASMGFAIASSGAKGKRYALPNAQFMAHQVSAGTYGNVQDMTASFEHTKKLNTLLMDIIGENCGITGKKLKKLTERDLWLDATEAIKFGVIDKIVERVR